MIIVYQYRFILIALVPDRQQAIAWSNDEV